VRQIRLFGDPVLNTPSSAVGVFDGELRRLVKDLHDTLTQADGAGLAAPQLGIGLRVFVYHVGNDVGHIVNPAVHQPDDEEQDGPEGCLSLPGLTFDCRRRMKVVAHGQNEYGDPISVEGNALVARCIQHETDHLDGVLFIDRLDTATRKAAMAAIRQADWSGLAPGPVKISPHAISGVLG